MEDEKIVDQTQLAESLAEKIKIEFARDFLVKPLEPVMVKKEFNKPVATDNTPKADENGIEAVDYDKVETEIKEVESDFKKGVVLKIPTEYTAQKADEKFGNAILDIKVGDIVIYPARAGRWYDQLKDAQMIRFFDIVAVEQ